MQALRADDLFPIMDIVIKNIGEHSCSLSYIGRMDFPGNIPAVLQNILEGAMSLLSRMVSIPSFMAMQRTPFLGKKSSISCPACK
jgi:hypothetical protein